MLIYSGLIFFALWLLRRLDLIEFCVLSVLALTSYWMITHFSGNFGWSVWFKYTYTSAGVAFPGEEIVHITPQFYIQTALYNLHSLEFRNVTPNDMVQSSLVLFVLFAALAIRFHQDQVYRVLTVATLPAIAIKFLVMPSLYPRYYAPMYLFLILSSGLMEQNQLSQYDLARELGEIPYSSSVTVALGYDESVRHSLPPGFGFLVPRSEGRRLLAATFVHNKFPHRAPQDRALLRCFLGGESVEQFLDSGDEQVLRIVREELQKIIGLTAEPLFVRVYRWRAAMAQYSVGHLERLQRIEALLQKLPGLALAGNGFNGIGVPDCVRSGAQAATRVLSEMGTWSAI
jgi:hypothetical protein